MKPDVIFHFSEDPTIEVFEPHQAATAQIDGDYVWAVTGSRVPSYWFPRQCPRATWWRAEEATQRVHAIEWSWFDRFVACKLYAYRFDPAPFELSGEDWCWTSTKTVKPLGIERVGPLLDMHRHAGIELWVVPDGQLLKLWDDVITRPRVEFSGIRLGNAAPRLS